MLGQKKIWAIHNWVGLYAGVVIAVLSITGVVALFKVEIDQSLNPHLFKVQPQEQKVPITPVIDSLKQVYGAQYFTSLALPKTPKDSYLATFFVRKGLSMHMWQVFINPYTGKVLGTRDNYKTTGFFIRNIHVRLFEGLFGRQIVGLAGIALLISTITGFLIYGNFMKKQLFGVIRTKNLRIKMADYHKLIGIATLLFNLMIAITGAWLGLQKYLQPALVGARPGVYKPAKKLLSKQKDVQLKVDYDLAYQRARQAFPELKAAYMFPSRNGDRTLDIRGSVPRTAFERNTIKLVFDKINLKELHRYDVRRASTGDKLFYIQESLHFGDYGGILLKLVYAFFGITSGFLALTGFIIYLKRTEKPRQKRPKFIELKPLLLRWTYGILAVIALLFVLHILFGLVVPTILTIAVLYLSILFLLFKALFMFIKKRFFLQQ